MNWSAFLTVMSGAKMDKALVWGRACKRARTHTHDRRGRAWSLFIIHHLWLEHEKSWWISSALAAEVSGSVLSLIKSVSFRCHRDQFASQSRFKSPCSSSACNGFAAVGQLSEGSTYVSVKCLYVPANSCKLRERRDSGVHWIVSVWYEKYRHDLISRDLLARDLARLNHGDISRLKSCFADACLFVTIGGSNAPFLHLVCQKLTRRKTIYERKF